MPGFFEKIANAAQQTANAAQEMASDGKIQFEITALNGKLNAQAEVLGHLAYRRHKGEAIAEEEFNKVYAEMASIEDERTAKEDQLKDQKK